MAGKSWFAGLSVALLLATLPMVAWGVQVPGTRPNDEGEAPRDMQVAFERSERFGWATSLVGPGSLSVGRAAVDTVPGSRVEFTVPPGLAKLTLDAAWSCDGFCGAQLRLFYAHPMPEGSSDGAETARREAPLARASGNDAAWLEVQQPASGTYVLTVDADEISVLGSGTVEILGWA